MKKLLLSTVLLFSFGASCEPESINEESNLNCKCGTIIDKAFYNIPNSSFTVLKVKNDCTGITETIQVAGNQGTQNIKWCNE